MTENEMTYRIKHSDREAFNALCRDRYASLFSYARLFVDADTAEDVVQDVMFAVWTNRSSLDESIDLQPYLVRSVYNRCMNIIRHKGVRHQYGNWYREKINSILSDHLAPECNPVMARIYNAELGESIGKAIASLPPRRSEVFTLSYIDNLSDKKNQREARHIRKHCGESHTSRSEDPEGHSPAGIPRYMTF